MYVLLEFWQKIMAILIMNPLSWFMIDVSIFAGHSAKRAATSAAAGSGVTMNDIMQAADWSSQSVFRNFYYRSSHDTTFGRAVLSLSASPGVT